MAHRTCIGCTQGDDHPKVVYVMDGNGTTVHWHHDCFALAHPEDPDAYDHGLAKIHAVVKSAKGKTGDALREHIHSPAHVKLQESLDADHDKRLAAAKKG